MGFITVGGGPLFFAFLMPLIGWRLGQKSYYHAKVRGFRDSLEFCVIIYSKIAITEWKKGNDPITQKK